MDLDEWQLLDSHEVEEVRVCSTKHSLELDRKSVINSNCFVGSPPKDLRDRDRITDQSVSVPNQQDTMISRVPCEKEIAKSRMTSEFSVEVDEDSVMQFSRQKMKENKLTDMKTESPRRNQEVSNGGLAEQKWGRARAAMCSVGIAVAATICTLLMGSLHGHNNKKNQQLHLQSYPCDES